MDNNLLLLLISGTMAFTSAGLWLWLGSNKAKEILEQEPELKERSFAKLSDELFQTALEHANANKYDLDSINTDRAFTLTELEVYKRPFKEAFDHYCKDGSLTQLSNPERALIYANECCGALIQDIEGSLQAAINGYNRLYEEVFMLKGELAALGETTSTRALSLMNNIKYSLYQLSKQAEAIESFRQELAPAVQDWLTLNPDVPIENSPVDYCIDLDVTPELTPIVEQTPSFAFSNTELIVICLFSVSVVFFISGLVYRYKKFKQPLADDEGTGNDQSGGSGISEDF